MNDNRNMILAVVLSALVLLGWSMLSEYFLPPTATPQTQKIENGQVKPIPQPQAGPVPRTPQKMRAREQVLAEAPRVQIRTPSLRGSINLMGARIDDLVILTQRQSISKTSAPVRLLSPAGAPDSNFISFGWTGEGLNVPGPDTRWSASSPVLEPGRPVTLTTTNGSGQRFAMQIAVDENYLFTVRQQVANGGNGPVAVRPYGLINRASKSRDPDSWTMHVGPIGYLDGAANYDTDWDDIENGQSTRMESRGGWLGFTDT